MEKDGSELYGKTVGWSLADSIDRDRPRPDIDQLFLEIMERDSAAIKEEVRKHAATAAANSLELAYDDPFELHVRPDGTWGVVALDLAKAKTNSDEAPETLRQKKSAVCRQLSPLATNCRTLS